MDRAALEETWLTLTRRDLPRVAGARGWPIDSDHCFQRVFLDAACGGVWYDFIAERPAYRAASDDQLRAAVALARASLEGRTDLAALNRRSVAWRRARRVETGRRGS